MAKYKMAPTYRGLGGRQPPSKYKKDGMMAYRTGMSNGM